MADTTEGWEGNAVLGVEVGDDSVLVGGGKLETE